jgi:hypothetical protein
VRSSEIELGLVLTKFGAPAVNVGYDVTVVG